MDDVRKVDPTMAPSKLLWIDCTAAAAAGVAMLLATPWLSAWYGLATEHLYLMGGANLLYGSYSFSLAIRRIRPKSLLILLVAANFTWAILCLAWAVQYGATASPFGLAHLVGEALFVGGLAGFEWRWLEPLRTA